MEALKIICIFDYWIGVIPSENAGDDYKVVAYRKIKASANDLNISFLLPDPLSPDSIQNRLEVASSDYALKQFELGNDSIRSTKEAFKAGFDTALSYITHRGPTEFICETETIVIGHNGTHNEYAESLKSKPNKDGIQELVGIYNY